MHICRHLKHATLTFSIAALLVVLTRTADAQSSGGPVIRDSSVGYIDPAVLADIVRLRYDTTYTNRQPARAELFYPKAFPGGPGLPQPDTSVDFQEFSLYCESMCSEQLSGFVNVPIRLINPEINANAEGVGDVDAGFKYALVTRDDLLVTSQLRVYAPTGDADRGLGNHHVSLEPALLVYRPLSECIRLEGELRYWTPIAGTDFAGDIFRYGAGLSFWAPPDCFWKPVPVVELVGWSVLGGKTSITQAPGQTIVEDAGGTTIVHVKAGLRNQLGDCTDLFVGYGCPITGDEWYENTLRVELRVLY